MLHNHAQEREATGTGKGRSSTSEVVSVDADLNGLVMGNWLLGAQHPEFRVGTEQTCDAPVETTPSSGQNHRLIELSGGACRIDLGTAAAGTVWWPHGGETVQGRYFELPSGAIAEVRWGAMRFRVERTPAPEVVPPATWQERLLRQWATGISILGVLLVIGLFAFVPPDWGAIGWESGVPRIVSAEFVRVPTVPPKPLPSAGSAAGVSTGGSKKTDGPRERIRKGQVQGSGNRNTTTRTAEASAADARTRGINGLIDRFSAMPAFDGIFAEKDDAAWGDVTGDLQGTHLTAWNPGGGVTGTGAAKAEGTRSSGDLGTIGKGCKGAGCGGGLEYGVDEGRLRRKGSPRVVFSADNTTRVNGGLDKDIVRRVIRSNLNQIRFCYEKELIKTPQLNGRLAVQFVIAGTGAVSTAVIKDSTLGSAGVESCVTQAVRRWSFPQGRSAGMTMVTYPFVFAPAGS